VDAAGTLFLPKDLLTLNGEHHSSCKAVSSRSLLDAWSRSFVSRLSGSRARSRILIAFTSPGPTSSYTVLLVNLSSNNLTLLHGMILSTRLKAALDKVSPRGLLGPSATYLKPLLAARRCCVEPGHGWVQKHRGSSRFSWKSETPESTLGTVSTPVAALLPYHLSAKLRNPLTQEWRVERRSK